MGASRLHIRVGVGDQLIDALGGAQERGIEFLVQHGGAANAGVAGAQGAAQDGGGPVFVRAPHGAQGTVVQRLQGRPSIGQSAGAQAAEVVPGQAFPGDDHIPEGGVVEGVDDLGGAVGHAPDHLVGLLDVVAVFGLAEAELPDLLALFPGEVGVQGVHQLRHGEDLVLIYQLLDGHEGVRHVDDGPVGHAEHAVVGMGLGEILAQIHAGLDAQDGEEGGTDEFPADVPGHGAQPQGLMDERLFLLEEGFIEFFKGREAAGVAGLQAGAHPVDVQAVVEGQMQDARQVVGRHALGAVVLRPVGQAGIDAAQAPPLAGLLVGDAPVHVFADHDLVALEQGDAAPGLQVGADGLAHDPVRGLIVPPEPHGGAGELQLGHHVEDEVAQLVGHIRMILAQAAHHDVVDAEVDLMGLLVHVVGNEGLGAPAADHVRQVGGDLLQRHAVFEVILEITVKILVGTGPVGVILHGVFKHLGQGAHLHELQGLMEGAGGIFGHILAGLRDLLQPRLFRRVAFPGGHLPGQGRIAVGMVDGGLECDDGRLPEIDLVHVRTAGGDIAVNVLLAAADIFLQAGGQDVRPVQGGGALPGDPVLQAGIPQLGGLRLLGPVPHQGMPGIVGALGHAVGLEKTGGLPQDLQLLPVQYGGGIQGHADDPVVIPDVVDIIAADVDGRLTADDAGGGPAHDLVEGMDPDRHVVHHLFQHFGGADLQILALGLMPGLDGQALPIHVHAPGGCLHGLAPGQVAFAEFQGIDFFQKGLVDFVHVHYLRNEVWLPILSIYS